MIGPEIRLRPGILDRLQKLSGLATDFAMAGAIGIDVEIYQKVKSGKQLPSLRFVKGVCAAFNFQPGEIVYMAWPTAAVRDEDAA